MLPILNIGPIAVQTPLLILLIGLWVAISFGSRISKNLEFDDKQLDDLILISILGGLIGARIFYALRFPQAFTGNLTSILSLNPELFYLPGGILTGSIVFLILLQRRSMNLWKTLDALTLPFGIFAIFLGFSHLASGEFYGLPTQLPWAVNLWGAFRHPTQIYEIVASSMIVGYLWRQVATASHAKDEKQAVSGGLFLEFVMLTSLSWIVLETFHANAIILVFNIRTFQLAAFFALLTSIILFNKIQIGPASAAKEEKL